jgi:hypothetical protein
MPKEEKATPATNLSSKQFYIDALNKIQGNNVITTYTRDRLMDMLNSGSRKEYTKFKKHFHDLLNLQETFDGED